MFIAVLNCLTKRQGEKQAHNNNHNGTQLSDSLSLKALMVLHMFSHAKNDVVV